MVQQGLALRIHQQCQPAGIAHGVVEVLYAGLGIHQHLAAADEAAAEGPSEVTLTLKSFGTAKVAVIKAIQSITGLGLMDAKKLVDAAPSVIKEKISPSEAEQYKKTLVDAGAEVEIK